jgi:hypothetical protein
MALAGPVSFITILPEYDYMCSTKLPHLHRTQDIVCIICQQNDISPMFFQLLFAFHSTPLHSSLRSSASCAILFTQLSQKAFFQKRRCFYTSSMCKPSSSSKNSSNPIWRWHLPITHRSKITTMYEYLLTRIVRRALVEEDYHDSNYYCNHTAYFPPGVTPVVWLSDFKYTHVRSHSNRRN